MREFVRQVQAFFSKNEAQKTVNPSLRFFFYVCFFMLTLALITHVAIYFVERSPTTRNETTREPAVKNN